MTEPQRNQIVADLIMATTFVVSLSLPESLPGNLALPFGIAFAIPFIRRNKIHYKRFMLGFVQEHRNIIIAGLLPSLVAVAVMLFRSITRQEAPSLIFITSAFILLLPVVAWVEIEMYKVNGNYTEKLPNQAL